MWISEKQCQRQREQSRQQEQCREHLLCSRNRKEAHASEVQKGRESGRRIRRSNGGHMPLKVLRFYSEWDEDLENEEKNGEE